MPSKSTKSAKPAAPPIKGAMTRETLRAEHDLSFKAQQAIKTGLEKLAAADGGKGVALYELDFAKLCEIGTAPVAQYREEFKDYWVLSKGKNPKRIWHGSKKHADETRSMIGVSLL